MNKLPSIALPSIAERRLLNQRITGSPRRSAADVVRWCGAVQAQEYEAAKWGLALRMPDGTTDQDIERTFARGDILRTHVMRPTWHFVARDDIRWLQDLTAPRVHRILWSYCRRSQLDRRTLVRATAIFERALRDQQHLTRSELRERLHRSGIVVAGVRLAFVTMYAELEAVICSGPRRAREFTYALVAERAPNARRIDRDEALERLTKRYFSSHGPATVRDFMWWSGLASADAKRGLEIANARREEIDGLVYWTMPLMSGSDARLKPRATSALIHLLPIYDEYLVAYRDRMAVPHGPGVLRTNKIRPGTYAHTLVVAGQVAGIWRTSLNSAAVDVTPVIPLTKRQRNALGAAIEKYSRFRR